MIKRLRQKAALAAVGSLLTALVLVLTALVLVLALTPRQSLFSYALSLGDEPLYVCGDGSVWLAEEDPFVNGVKLIPTGVWAPWYAERGIFAEDRELSPWSFALRLGKNKVFIRSDGSLYMSYFDMDGESRVLPFMEENTAEPVDREGLELRDLKLSYIPDLGELRTSLHFTLLSAAKLREGLTARLSVSLNGHWLSVTPAEGGVGPAPPSEAAEGVLASFSLPFWSPPGRHSQPGLIPAAVYRVELWEGDTLLRTKTFLLQRSGSRYALSISRSRIREWLEAQDMEDDK